ncbi:hypothetical protein ZHAS_00017819 [Anopheles sinensis]|uniref:Uncharacterized protein n=1 Tax=Anopheles sinensis TaxID=74873 RepID=A0A084WHV7_ANOSI|nr:hypothetical protein ZHAS_00017819 [Anopheles sinensis]
MAISSSIRSHSLVVVLYRTVYVLWSKTSYQAGCSSTTTSRKLTLTATAKATRETRSHTRTRNGTVGRTDWLRLAAAVFVCPFTIS